MIETKGIMAYVFDGKESARQISPQDIASKTPGKKSSAFLWVHLNYAVPEAVAWLAGSGVDSLVFDALTAEETRPRCTVHGAGALLNLRGVNLDPGAEPEDMISIRLWIEGQRVISLGLRPLMAVSDLFETITRKYAPVTPGDLIAKLALRLADRAEPTVAVLNEQVDELEEQVLENVAFASREKLANVRRTSIVLRRYMFPQRDALATLEIEDFDWLSERDRSHIREAAERVTRLGEELDALRDRAQVVHDQILDRRAEVMNKQMLVLSIVAAVFLPLGLLTGLLGINVGGIPGSDSPWGFTVVCGLLVVISAAQVWLFKRAGLF